MTDAREIDGFCTDCGNWTDLRGPIGDRRCRCGSGRVAVPPAGYRILGPDEVDPVTLGKVLVAVNEIAQRGYSAAYRGGAMDCDAAIRALGRKA